MSYIDDILGGFIDEGKDLVRGYVNDALDPVGEILIDALQAIGILDSMESEWQKFNKEEIAKYKDANPSDKYPEEIRSPRATEFSDSYKKYQDEMLQAPHQADAQAHFNLLRQVPQPVAMSLRHVVDGVASYGDKLNRPPAIKGGWTDELKAAYKEAAEEATKKVLGSFDRRTRTFLDNLDETHWEGPNDLVSSQQEGYRHNHKLELAGKLEFAYPAGALRRDRMGYDMTKPPGVISKYDEEFNVFSLPFFENPKISESRSATYSDNTIVNRNEPYKVWMGAKGKQVNLDFNINMPHLITFATTQFIDLTLHSIHNPIIKKQILNQLKALNEERSGKDLGDGSNVYDLNGSESFYDTTNSILNDPSHPLGLVDRGAQSKTRAQVILYTVYLLDMIRTSVIGSTQTNATRILDSYEKKQAHPPITFLTFGALYHEEPFIVKSYSLNFDGKHGYEELSLLPRNINVKLKLESYDQLGNAQSFQGLSARYQL